MRREVGARGDERKEKQQGTGHSKGDCLTHNGQAGSSLLGNRAGNKIKQGCGGSLDPGGHKDIMVNECCLSIRYVCQFIITMHHPN